MSEHKAMSDAPTAAHQAELLKASTADHHATTLEAYADAMEKCPTEQLVARQVEAMVIKACRAGAAALRGVSPSVSAAQNAHSQSSILLSLGQREET